MPRLTSHRAFPHVASFSHQVSQLEYVWFEDNTRTFQAREVLRCWRLALEVLASFASTSENNRTLSSDAGLFSESRFRYSVILINHKAPNHAFCQSCARNRVASGMGNNDIKNNEAKYNDHSVVSGTRSNSGIVRCIVKLDTLVTDC